MIYAVCLNPSLDKTASIARFDPDAPNRITVERLDVGGKGVNVARVIRNLGESALLIGFDFSHGPVAAAMEAEGVPCRLISVQGDLRVNLKLRETDTGRTIEINEQGPEIGREALRRVESLLRDMIRPGDWVSLSGSLPTLAPPETYAHLCAALKRAGAKVAADCDGPAFAFALDAGPDLVKPNAQEFESLTGVNPLNRPAAIRACRAWITKKHVGKVCLSMGGQGALLVTAEGACFCPAADVPVLGTQGAGDSMLAALLTAFSRGVDDADALRYASAAAGASVLRPGTLLCQRDDMVRLYHTLCAVPVTAD